MIRTLIARLARKPIAAARHEAFKAGVVRGVQFAVTRLRTEAAGYQSSADCGHFPADQADEHARLTAAAAALRDAADSLEG